MALQRATAAVFLLLAACGAEEGAATPPSDLRADVSPQPATRRDDDPPTARRGTLEELREAHDKERHPSDGGGRAWLELEDGEDGSIRAGRFGRWTIVYEAGPLGIDVGGSVRLLAPPFWEWSPAQSDHVRAPGYTTVESLADGVELRTIAHNWFECIVEGRRLQEGERIRFTYGAGDAKAEADRYAERDSRFWIAVDGNGDRVPGVVADSPAITVLPGPAARLRLTLPSVSRPGEPVRLNVCVLDPVGNAGPRFEGQIELEPIEGEWEDLPTLSFTPGDGAHRTVELRPRGEGVHRLRGRFRRGNLEVDADANPLLVSPDAPLVRWGDLHGHSNLSDGTGTPEDYFLYARDVAALDIVALTDHDHWGVRFLDENPDLWEHIREVTARFHEPGRFVTLLGYEWTNWIHGHRHVLYRDEDGPILSAIDPDYETPRQLWDGLAALEIEALTFAHHSAGGPIATDWSFAPDPRFEPVTEVVSVHGASEAPDAPIGIYRPLPGNFVRDALDRGYRLGFVGSGDSHDGHPGHAHLGMRTGGLAAILTPELTRDGVFHAMHDRRVYATNGERILLQCALNGNRMGTTIPAGELGESVQLYVRAIGVSPLETIDVVRNGEIELRLTIPGELEVAVGLDLEPLESGDYVYVRVVQEDDGAAWSSPFFVD